MRLPRTIIGPIVPVGRRAHRGTGKTIFLLQSIKTCAHARITGTCYGCRLNKKKRGEAVGTNEPCANRILWARFTRCQHPHERRRGIDAPARLPDCLSRIDQEHAAN